MEKRRKLGILVVAVFCMMICGFSFASAQSKFPEKYIEVVVPLSPGGGGDLSFIPFKDRVGKALGQPLVVTHKPGAGGVVGTTFVSKAKADGYTLLFANKGGLISAPLLKKGIGYSMADFTPICLLTRSPSIVHVKWDDYQSLQDFIKAAKTKTMKYATYGALSVSHMNVLWLEKHAGFHAVHIPSGGAGEANVALLGGHVDMTCETSAGKLIGPGKIRAVALSSPKRWDLYPDVPTFAELGFPALKGDPFSAMYSLWAPKGTPKEIIDKIYGAFKKVIDENGEEIAKEIRNAELNLDFQGPKELGEVAQEEYGFLKKMYEEMGVTPK